MKGKALTMALMLALSILAVEAVLVDIAQANFILEPWFPREPVRTPPAITVYSPSQNQTFNSSSVLLNFTISKPETWFGYFKNEHFPTPYLTIGKVLSYNYSLDGGESQTFPVDDALGTWTSNPEETLNFSANLNLTYGAHKIAITAQCETYYLPFSGITNSFPVHGYSEVVSFYVGSYVAAPNAFPTVPVTAASSAAAVAAVAGLLVYFRKRKPKEAAE